MHPSNFKKFNFATDLYFAKFHNNFFYTVLTGIYILNASIWHAFNFNCLKMSPPQVFFKCFKNKASYQ